MLEPYIESFYFAPNDIILIDGLEFSFGPDELCAYGATMTYEASTPLEAFKKQVQKGISKFRYNEQDETYDNKIKILDYVKKKERKILEDSVGRGHASIPDLPPLVFVLKNVPRAFTLQICAYQFINPLQESGRRVGARGFTLPRNIPERWKIKIQNKLGELNYLREKLFEKVYDLVRDRLKNSYIRNYDEKTREEALEEKSLTRSTEVCRGLFPLYQASNIIVASSLEGFIQFFRDSQHPDIPSTQKEITQIMLEKIKVAMPLLAEQALRVDPLKYYPAPQFYKKNSFIKKVIEKYNYPKKPVLIKVYDFI
ncbi:MAG: FAD-dependent thymidylate synthase, partial [Candidatus Aenigmatarchaeota archaeon]